MGIKVSVILPVYNAAKYLDRCMASLMTQSMVIEDYEVILVDDGSKDSSPELCDEYADKYSNVTVIHQENGGAAAARNAGLLCATGEYVAFVDPDDYVEKDYLSAPYEAAIRDNADVVLFDAIRIEGTKRTLLGHAGRAFCTHLGDTHDLSRQFLQGRVLYPYMTARIDITGKESEKHIGDIELRRNIPLSAPWDKLYRRSFLIENELKFPANLRVLDDMCFNFMALGKAVVISYIPKALYYYCIDPASITNSYKENRPELDMKVFSFLDEQISSDYLRRAYYARIIKSFAICCRLCFFNAQNPLSDSGRRKKVKQYMSSSPYREAFLNSKKSDLEWKLRIVVLAGRIKSPRMLQFLDRLQNG